ncbi:hypothetical protein WG66_012007 [Moniliophthora roreri]|nr:hypothetical protein WG66_012007 [Moniliophthora roreri]
MSRSMLLQMALTEDSAPKNRTCDKTHQVRAESEHRTSKLLRASSQMCVVA